MYRTDVPPLPYRRTSSTTGTSSRTTCWGPWWPPSWVRAALRVCSAYCMVAIVGAACSSGISPRLDPSPHRLAPSPPPPRPPPHPHYLTLLPPQTTAPATTCSTAPAWSCLSSYARWAGEGRRLESAGCCRCCQELPRRCRQIRAAGHMPGVARCMHTITLEFCTHTHTHTCTRTLHTRTPRAHHAPASWCAPVQENLKGLLAELMDQHWEQLQARPDSRPPALPACLPACLPASLVPPPRARPAKASCLVTHLSPRCAAARAVLGLRLCRHPC